MEPGSSGGSGDDSDRLDTLESWQLLASQLAHSASQQLDDEAPQSSATSLSPCVARSLSRTSRLPGLTPLQLRSYSTASMLSDSESVLSSCQLVTPKQHHQLYKEYRLSREIGNGAFGRCYLARRLCDGKEVVVSTRSNRSTHCCVSSDHPLSRFACRCCCRGARLCR